MAISLAEILDLGRRFHDVVGIEKGDAGEQAAFFLHPHPMIYVAHDADLTLQTNYEIHQGYTDEEYVFLEPWDVVQLCAEPERARAVGAVLWRGNTVGGGAGDSISVVVGEDWIVQRTPEGDVKFALYVNTHHQSLPGAAKFSLPRD